MNAVQQVLTDHIDIWTAVETERKSARGRAAGNATSVYGINKLRELILDLAVRGKLVPQDSNDEPASVLLNRLSNEKAKLIAEGRAKQSKPQPKISNGEKPFEIPTGWEWIRLSDFVLNIISGGTPSKNNSEFWNGDIPWASVKDLNVEKFITKTVDYITKAGLDAGSKLANKGDLLICTRMGLGKIAIAAMDVAINQDLKALKLSQLINVDYFINFYRTLKIVGSGMTVAGIRQEELLGYCIPTPPLAEQHRIAAKVDELMELCNQLEAKHNNAADAHEQLVEFLLGTLTQSQSAADFNANWQRVAAHFDTLFTTEASVDALKKTLIQLAIIGKLVEQDSRDEPVADLLKRIIEERDRKIESEGSRTSANEAIIDSEVYMSIPKNWTYFRLGNLARFIDYRGKTPNKIDSGVPLITAKNVRFGYISREPKEFISTEEYKSWMTRGFPQPGDLLFTTEAPLGNVAVIDIVEEFALAQRVICFQLHDKSISNFLKIALMSNKIQQRLVSAATGMTATGIKASKLKEILIPIPPIQEQLRIVAKVDELTMLCEELKFRIINAKRLQKKIADVFVAASTGTSNVSKKYSPPNAETMKITTTLEVNSQVNTSIVEPLAKIIVSLGGAADAKEVWKKSNLDLPEFYKQLKIEIESGFIRRPESATFDALRLGVK